MSDGKITKSFFDLVIGVSVLFFGWSIACLIGLLLLGYLWGCIVYPFLYAIGVVG